MDFLILNETIKYFNRALEAIQFKPTRSYQNERPDLLTTTCLRKHISTCSQLLHLNDSEQDWLARHLGHDIKVHREYYRLHDKTIELAHVSNILFAIISKSILVPTQKIKYLGMGIDLVNRNVFLYPSFIIFLNTRLRPGVAKFSLTLRHVIILYLS